MLEYNALKSDFLADKYYDFDSLLGDRKSLSIRISKVGGDTVEIIFSPAMSYRCIDEGDALLTSHEMSSAGCSGDALYEAKNSLFLQSFFKERFEDGNRINYRHFCVSTNDEIIDVIALEAPVIRLLSLQI